MSHDILFIGLIQLTSMTLIIPPTIANVKVLIVSSLYGYIIDSSLQKKLRWNGVTNRFNKRATSAAK